MKISHPDTGPRDWGLGFSYLYGTGNEGPDLDDAGGPPSQTAVPSRF